MKIFISWSGERSKKIGASFKDWLPAVIQAARPYFSPNDIDKGARWSAEISKELESSSVGLICLTKDNLSAPWLMFEAGALSKSLEKSRVCPMLFGVDPSDLAGPLVQFQATPFSKDEVRKLIHTVNSQLSAQALESGILDSVFEKWWPDLEGKINQILQDQPAAKDANIRSDREILEEVLQMTRGFSNLVRNLNTAQFEGRSLKSAAVQAVDLIDQLTEYGLLALQLSKDSDLLKKYLELLNELGRYLAITGGDLAVRKLSARLRPLIDKLQQKIEQLDDEIPF